MSGDRPVTFARATAAPGSSIGRMAAEASVLVPVGSMLTWTRPADGGRSQEANGIRQPIRPPWHARCANKGCATACGR